MIAAQYQENSTDFERIELKEVNKPVADVGEVVVNIIATSLNPVDAKVFAGDKKAIWAMPLPFTPGYDVSGIVESVHDDSLEWKVGDEVFAVNWGHKGHSNEGQVTVGGAFAHYISLPASKLSLKPANVTHETAAALALVGCTALEALNEIGVAAGSKILILGGAGAFVATTASARTLGYVRQFGADHIINYNEQSWWLAAENGGLTDFDFVFDSVGEAGSFAHSQTEGLVKLGGSYVTISAPSAQEVGGNPIAHQPRFLYASVYTLSHDKAIQDELIHLVSIGALIVPIDEVFPFTQQGVLDIFKKVVGGKSLGKNVLRIV